MASMEEQQFTNNNIAAISSSASSNSLSSLSSNSTHNNLNNNNPSALSLNLFNSASLLAEKDLIGSEDLKSNLSVGAGLEVTNCIVDKLMSSLILEDQQNSGGVVPSTPPSSVGDLSSLVSSRSSSLAEGAAVASAGNMLSNVFDGKPSDLEGGSLEDSLTSEGLDRNCKICSSRLISPRVLSCLHVFCETCLQKMLSSDDLSSNASSTSSNAGDLLSPAIKGLIECPTCKQITTLGPKGVESLTCDYILTNILDLSTIESEQLSCTSCKSKEKAISRCSDCANFLCGGCDHAHKYMRCFENHEVLKLEDLQKSSADKPMSIHKPLFCSLHSTENLKYYCFNCQMTVCNDCLIADHKGSEHHYDVIGNAEKNVRGDVENLMKEAKSKVQYCDMAATNLTSALTELQTQHDTARDRINETYENYMKILEKCRDQSLNELGKLHSERELKIMDLLQNIENTMDKIEGGCKFTTRVLEQANAAEFLSMKKLISAQFIHLINNTPKCDINYSLTFDTRAEKFEQMARESFGKFRTESTPPSPKESTPPPTLPGMPPNMMNGSSVSGGRGGLNSSNNSQGQLTSSVTASSPISLPTSMQSSFDGDLSVLGGGGGNGAGVGPGNNSNFMMQHGMTPDSPPQQSSAAMMQHQFSHPPPSHAGVNGFGMGPTGMGNGSNGLNGLMGNGNAGLNQGNGSGMPNGLNGLNGGLNGGQGSNAGPPPAFNSMLEYNLARLASLTETTGDNMNDGMVGGPVGGVPGNVQHNQAVVPSNGGGNNQHITLADILSGDQRALNNLQALAKLGLNNNVEFHTDMNNHHNHFSHPPPIHQQQQQHQLLSSGPSPVLDCLLSDFCLPSATSPSLSLGGNANNGLGPVDDMSITNFHAGATPGSTSIVTGRNKATPMQIRCKFGSLGTSKAQFNSPHGFCLGVDEEIIVADTNNHRIQIFDKTGTLKFQFGVPGKEEGQLWYPRKVAVMHTNGKFVVCDRGNERSRMQIFSKCGHFMRKIAIRYIDIVAGLAVTSKGHIVAVDSVSPTVFVISEDGELVRWFDCSDYMREPSDIAIRDNDFYVCDFKGHCVAVFQEDGTFQYRIGNEKVTCFPNGIDISNAGDILIGDSHGNRFHVACYSREGVLQSEFECPHVKVSRCCGLKITSEGYVVTLAKNNHHVLVLNTLYVH